MKIASIVLNDFRHDSRVLKMCKTLMGGGHEVEVFAIWRPGLAQTGEQDGVKYRRIKLKTYKLNSVFNPLKFLEFCFMIRRYCRSSDIWLCNDFEALAVYFVSQKLGVKSHLVYDSHELQSDCIGIKNGTFRRFIISMERRILKSGTPVFNVSPGIVEIYNERYHLKNQHLIMNLPLRVNLDTKPDIFRSKWSIPQAATVFIMQGKFVINRGVENVVKAFCESDPEKFVLILMGFGPLWDELEIVAKENSNIFLQESVPHDEIIRHTASADWGISNVQNVCLSYYHSLPNKLFEYVQASIPVIASELYDTKNVIDKYEIGITMNGESVGSIKNALQEAQDRKASSYSDALKAAAKVLNWESQEATILEVFDEMEID